MKPGPLALRVTPPAERALKQGHPWVFDKAVVSLSREGKPGDLAVIFDRKGRFLAVGLYDPASTIRVRVLQHQKPATINQEWFRAKLSEAATVRKPLETAMTTGYRLVHGENDGFPGLVVDRYDKTLVMKIYSAVWIPHLKGLVEALMELQPAERLVLRTSRALRGQSGTLAGLSDGKILSGAPLSGPVLFEENGLTFECDPVEGQKTGFFLDQRDNRARVEKLSGGKTVLNLFAYTGGFSVYAARGGARKVVSVDTSEPALKTALRNMAHNRKNPAVAAANHEIIAGDAFEVLLQMGKSKRQFDLAIIDPPMFAQSKAQVASALAAYARLTGLGVKLLRPGGILVQASCSSQIDAESFYDAVFRAAQTAGRPLKELERTGHALDHPISFKEGAYLKCLFAAAT